MFGLLAINSLFGTQSTLMGHFAGSIDMVIPIGRQHVRSPLRSNYMTTVLLIDSILTQWPLIFLKSSWVDSQWADVTGNIPWFIVVRQTYSLDAGVKTVLSPLPIEPWRSDSNYAQTFFSNLLLQLFISRIKWQISLRKRPLRLDTRM